MNCRIKVEGIGEIQVTARGATGQETACRLYEAMAAVVAPQSPQSPEPETFEKRLTDLLAKGTLKAVNRGDMGLVERLHKAFLLALASAVGVDECGHYAVTSQTDQARTYEVVGTSCSCPDWKRHHHDGEAKYCCKHVLAVAMVSKATAL
jgi:hypothetical protein